MKQKQAEYKTKLADKPTPKAVVKPPKKCETCGESIPGESKARFCQRCLRKRHSAQVIESSEKMEKIKKGEILDPPRTCVICGNEILRTRNRQAKTCSDTCSQKLNKQRMRENYIKKHPVKRPPGRKPTGNNMQPLNVAVPQDVLKKIKTTAREKEITVSEYVRKLIQQGVEKEKKT